MATFFSRLRQARTHRQALARKAGRRRLPAVEIMETRQLLSALPAVTNVNDSGPGSLRQAILALDVDNNTTPDTISFNMTGSSLANYQIKLQTPLPGIFRPVTIDATSLEANVPGATGPVLDLIGNNAGSKAVGLQVYTSGATIKGLAIDGFAGGGVQVDGSATNGVGGGSSNTLSYLSVGVNDADAVNPNGGFGIELINGAHNNFLQSDVVAGNQGTGIVISGSGTNSNELLSDFVGNDTAGHWYRNSGYGIQVTGGSSSNSIIASYAVDSGNAGVYFGPGSTGNLVAASDLQNNGANALEIDGSSNNTVMSSTLAYSNNTGVWIHSEPNYNATGNVIGSAYQGGGNVISGNGNWGVYISDSGSTGNTVQNDFIGVDGTGEHAMPNAFNGVDIVNGASYNTIGGTVANTRNIISGNAYEGVLIFGSHNTVAGNYIGVDAAGTKALANGDDGVYLGMGAASNVIGGTINAARNIISGNASHGVQVTDSGTSSNLIQANFIGTNAVGTAAVPNHDGVVIVAGATYTSVVGDVISGNTGDGVYISGGGTSFNHVWSDFIGVDASGENALGNGIYGVAITLGATWDYVGQDFNMNAGGNVISANGSDGVYLASAGSNADYIEYNLIGVDHASVRALGNHGNGVTLDGGASWDYVENNTISGNSSYGLEINGSSTDDNTVLYNVIGTVQGGGVWIGNGASGIALVGTTGDLVAGNYLWSNGGWGIVTYAGAGSNVNSIYGNNYGVYGGGNTNRNGDFASF